MEAWIEYIPEGFAVDYIKKILSPYTVQVRVSKPRKTKLGDYRNPYKGATHKISINDNLNTYSFLITLIHEIAHLVIWEQYQHKVPAHGIEWKRMYYELLQPCVDEGVFPSEIALCLNRDVDKIKAGANSDVLLAKVLNKYDTKEAGIVFIEELNLNDIFQYKKRIFRINSKSVKRYKCEEIGTKKLYLFSPIAEVKLVEN